MTKVTKDTLWIKWLPVDYQSVLYLAKGATIRRVEGNSDKGLQNLDYSSGIKWVVAPLEERFRLLNRQDSVQDRMATLLDPIMEPIEKEAENFAFGSVLIENVTQPLFQFELGNVLLDTEFDRRKKYAYEIVIGQLEPIYVFVDPSQLTEFSVPNLELELDQKKTVVGSWDLSTTRKQAFAFDILHAIGNTKNSELLFKEPYLPFKSEFEKNQDRAEVRHDKPKKGEMHYYQIVGRDAFGAPSLVSEWKEIYIPNTIEAYPVIDSILVDNDTRHVLVSSPGFSGSSQNYKLFRSKKRDTDYETLSSTRISIDGAPDQSLFTVFRGEKSGDAYYYKVALMNEDDTVYSQPFYHFTLDQEAPDAPQGLEIKIDSNGIARLDWNSLDDSGLLGYRVFRGNSKSEEFVERTNILSLQTSWTDTLALDNLTSEVFYFIKGVDANYNQGAHSDTVMGLKPDTIPPVAGQIRKISMIKNGISLELIPSTSKDAITNVLYRGSERLGKVETFFIDTTVVPGKFYSYRVITEDGSGNTSQSKVVSQKFEPGYRSAPTGSIKADFQNNFIEISYQLPDIEIYSVQIYRAKVGESSRRWKTIHDLKATSIRDSSIHLGEVYNYQVKYITKEGIHSLPLELTVSF